MTILTLKKLYRSQQFCPTVFGIFINPFYHSRKSLHKHILMNSHYIRGTVLDIGCGTKPYQNIFNNCKYLGIEIDSSKNRKLGFADFFYDGELLPFPDKSIDSVVSFQVFEHVKNLDFLIREIHRVLKDDGVILITVPLFWEEHEVPYDFRRFTSFGIKDFFSNEKFICLKQDKLTKGSLAISQVLIATIESTWLGSKPSVFKFICFHLISSLINILAIPVDFFLKSEKLYLDNLIIAKKST